MITYSGVESALLTINERVQLSGIASRGALVRRSGTFFASGVVSGPLTIEAGGRAVVSGVVSGTVSIAEGAALEVSGVVSGAILRNDGEFRAAVGVVIHGKQLTSSGAFAAPSSDAIHISDDTPRFLLHGVGTRLSAVRAK